MLKYLIRYHSSSLAGKVTCRFLDKQAFYLLDLYRPDVMQNQKTLKIASSR